MSASLTLLLNAAEQRLQFGLVREGELLCGQDWAAASRGVELLTPALHDVLRRLDLSPSHIGRIACVRGPGGFTGLRLALATASALHLALDAPLAGLNYLQLLAEGAPCAIGQTVRVMTRARRDLVYRQDFLRTDSVVVQPQGEPLVCAIQAAYDSLPLSKLPVLCIGSGVAHCVVQPAQPDAAVSLLPDVCDQPVWGAFLRLAEHADYGSAELEPLYLRGSEAEDNLEMLAERRGDDPVQARFRLQQLLMREPESMTVL